MFLGNKRRRSTLRFSLANRSKFGRKTKLNFKYRNKISRSRALPLSDRGSSADIGIWVCSINNQRESNIEPTDPWFLTDFRHISWRRSQNGRQGVNRSRNIFQSVLPRSTNLDSSGDSRDHLVSQTWIKESKTESLPIIASYYSSDLIILARSKTKVAGEDWVFSSAV